MSGLHFLFLFVILFFQIRHFNLDALFFALNVFLDLFLNLPLYSFDQFINFEQRGDAFVRLVRQAMLPGADND